MLYLSCSMILSVDLARYGVSHATDLGIREMRHKHDLTNSVNCTSLSDRPCVHDTLRPFFPGPYPYNKSRLFHLRTNTIIYLHVPIFYDLTV